MTEVTKQITVYDSHGDGMNETRIRFNDDVMLTFDRGYQMIFNERLFCGENTYQCLGTYNSPNWANENSFQIEGDEKKYECTQDCIENKCTFNIACENPDSPESDSADQSPDGAGQLRMLNNLFLATMERCSDRWKTCGDTKYSTVEEFAADLSETEFNDVYLTCLKLQLNESENVPPFSGLHRVFCLAPCRPPAKKQGIYCYV